MTFRAFPFDLPALTSCYSSPHSVCLLLCTQIEPGSPEPPTCWPPCSSLPGVLMACPCLQCVFTGHLLSDAPPHTLLSAQCRSCTGCPLPLPQRSPRLPVSSRPAYQVILLWYFLEVRGSGVQIVNIEYKYKFPVWLFQPSTLCTIMYFLHEDERILTVSRSLFLGVPCVNTVCWSGRGKCSVFPRRPHTFSSRPFVHFCQGCC